MKSPDVHAMKRWKPIPLVAGAVVLTVLVALGILYGNDVSTSSSRQAEIAARGTQVMPFDLERTTHVFQTLPNGGLQTVTAKDPSNHEQITLIQAHLKEEADKFRQGDFSDPAKIHGADMPGLAALRAGAEHIEVQYTALPNGAQIRYATKDPALVMAIHHWFMAQRADHGRHASDH